VLKYRFATQIKVINTAAEINIKNYYISNITPKILILTANVTANSLF